MRTTDNNVGKLFTELDWDSENDSKEDLLSIANKTIIELANEEQLLIFPHSLNAVHNDLESNNYIFSLHQNSIGNDVLTTTNVMGFVGRNKTQLTISSRFHHGEDDNFLHYMLCKVFAINVFNLEHSRNIENIWDFILYLFPFYLKKALSQGLFKEYQRREYNDANVKGPIEIARHIRLNYPFMGKIAYRTREHSFDNRITQLIRHTIEYIKRHKFGSGILQNDPDTQDAVNQFVDATPTYEANKRISIINQNTRTLSHPYSTEYIALQKICLQILRHDGLTYGKEKDKVYGLLFDGAWLWEEYLNIILKEFEFVHPENRKKENGIPLFTPNKSMRFPDSYSKDKSIVLDAKYKRFENWDPNKENNSDIYQIITYLHCLKSKKGGLLFPVQESDSFKFFQSEKLGELHGYGGNLFKIGLLIPKTAKDFRNFVETIKVNEIHFVEEINSQVQLTINRISHE